LGKLSDMIDRRWVMSVACLVAVFFALLISRESDASIRL
jgi:hypothetical protein